MESNPKNSEKTKIHNAAYLTKVSTDIKTADIFFHLSFSF